MSQVVSSTPLAMRSSLSLRAQFQSHLSHQPASHPQQSTQLCLALRKHLEWVLWHSPPCLGPAGGGFSVRPKDGGQSIGFLRYYCFKSAWLFLGTPKCNLPSSLQCCLSRKQKGKFLKVGIKDTWITLSCPHQQPTSVLRRGGEFLAFLDHPQSRAWFCYLFVFNFRSLISKSDFQAPLSPVCLEFSLKYGPGDTRADPAHKHIVCLVSYLCDELWQTWTWVPCTHLHTCVHRLTEYPSHLSEP